MTNKASLTLEQIHQKKLEFEKELAKLEIQETNIIKELKSEAFLALLSVVDKYKLSGTDIVNCLLENRKVDIKVFTTAKPVNLLTAKIQKKNRKTHELVDAEFNFYEGKTILADTEFANSVCSGGVESFKAKLTEAGKKYLANDETRSIIVNFYNTYKPSTAAAWDGL